MSETKNRNRLGFRQKNNGNRNRRGVRGGKKFGIRLGSGKEWGCGNESPRITLEAGMECDNNSYMVGCVIFKFELCFYHVILSITSKVHLIKCSENDISCIPYMVSHMTI